MNLSPLIVNLTIDKKNYVLGNYLLYYVVEITSKMKLLACKVPLRNK